MFVSVSPPVSKKYYGYFIYSLFPYHIHVKNGGLAQMVERVLSMHEVAGSMPASSTTFFFGFFFFFFFFLCVYGTGTGVQG